MNPWFAVVVIALVTCIVFLLIIDAIAIARGGAKAPVSVPDKTCDCFHRVPMGRKT